VWFIQIASSGIKSEARSGMKTIGTTLPYKGRFVLMIENYRTGLLWNIMRRCPAVVTGLKRAGFKGGWLDSVAGII
jgi:hypothetical protein